MNRISTVCLLVVSGLVGRVYGESMAAAPSTAPMAATSALSSMGSMSPSALESLASDNPLGLLGLARERCRREISDYSCVFTKRELVKGQLRGPTTLLVRHRAEPFSVLMTLRHNRGAIKRALYVEGARIDDHGNELMLVEPTGWRRLLVSEAEIPIDDDRVMDHNRTTIDQFGFQEALDRLHGNSIQAYQAGVLELTYEGRGRIDGRPTLILKRRLPAEQTGSSFPDALTVVHLDEEWLVPVSIDRFVDSQGRQLLGSYRVTGVNLNPGFGDEAFRF